MFSALIVSGRSESAQRRAFQFDALEISVEGEIEIEARLLAIRDHIQAIGHLVVNGGDDGIFLKFRAVSLAELVKVGASEFEPTGKWVAPDDGGAEGHLNR
jgi:hypothetical protein